MASSNPTVIAFDLYGTLLSTDSIANELAKHFGSDKAASLAALWRRYQLEYTWRLNSMKQYQPFSTINRSALTQALADSSLTLDEASIENLMQSYNSLSTFPDVGPALSALAEDPSIKAVVFSNGTHNMASTSVHKSPDLSPHSALFKHIVTVEEVACFKPHPAMYHHLAETVGVGHSEEDMGRMWLVSGNPFDVVGARAVGMLAAWVDRGGAGWTDAMVEGESGRPTAIVKGLGEAVEAVKKHMD